MVISLIFLIVNISWKKERERELWPERSSMVREQWPWHHQLLLLLFPSSSSSRYFLSILSRFRVTRTKQHSRWACLSETSCLLQHVQISQDVAHFVFWAWRRKGTKRLISPKVGSVVVHLHRQIGCASLSFLFSCGFWWWWWFTKWRHFRVDIFCEKKRKMKVNAEWILVVFVGTFTGVSAGVFFSSSSEQIVWRKKKGKLLFSVPKCRLFIHRCVCV